MPLSPPCCSGNPCPLFLRLRRAVKAWIHVPFFNPCVANLAVKGRVPLSSTPKEKIHLKSAGAKHSEQASCPTPVNAAPSNVSSITLPDTGLAPPNHICGPVLQLPPSIGTKITDRFWPESDPECSDSDGASWKGGPASPVNVLAPPPYHRRSQSADVLFRSTQLVAGFRSE